MNINTSNAFYSGVTGLQKAFNQVDASATNIANQSLSTENKVSPTSPSVEDSLVQLNVAEVQGKASANVIDRENLMLGLLVDIKV